MMFSCIQRDSRQEEIREATCLMQERMAMKALVLWLLFLGAVVPQCSCQHWSYGLSPGGKRELSDTPANALDGFPRMDTRCRVLGCAEESPFSKVYKGKGFLGSVNDRENGHGSYEK